MAAVSVLFVDDEEDIRFSFEDYFEGLFPLRLAKNGEEALQALQNHKDIGVVVTDIRMPEMDGLELIQEARKRHTDLGFIVVSGHGDAEDIIQALRLGARNYLKKPYDFNELHSTIQQEVRRFELLQEELHLQNQQKRVEDLITEVSGLSFELPSSLELINPLAFRVASMLETVGVIDSGDRGNMTLAVIEILSNAIEHGNFEISGEEKILLKSGNERAYAIKLEERAKDPAFCRRKVKITVSANAELGEVRVEDEGKGFDFRNLPDPTLPENLFLPSGRGLLLARAFLDEVRFEGQGNVVVLIKRRKAIESIIN